MRGSEGEEQRKGTPKTFPAAAAKLTTARPPQRNAHSTAIWKERGAISLRYLNILQL
jgi:hypothetical protein